MRSWPLLLAAALGCGDVRTVTPPDAAAADDTDAAIVAPGLVTVQVDGQFDGATFGDPLVGLPVLFFGPDHALIAEEETDDEGVASATVPPGSVVIVLAEADADEYITFAIFDVQPGDEIVFASPEPPPVPSLELDPMTIDFPDLGSEDLSYYRADNGCTNNTSAAESSTMSLSFDASCVDEDDEFDVVVRALDAQDDVIAAAHGHFTYSSLGEATLESWNGTQDLEVAFTAIPDELRQVIVNATPAAGALGYGTMQTDPIEPPDDSQDAVVGGIDGFGDSLDVYLDYRPLQNSLGRQQALYRLPPGTSDLPLALDTDLLPWYGLPSFEGATRTARWTRTSGGGSPDAQYVYVFGETKSATDRGILLVVPPDWTSATLPELPDDFPDHAVDDYSLAISFVQAIEVSGYEGYAIREAAILPFLWAFDDFPTNPDVGFHIKISGNAAK